MRAQFPKVILAVLDGFGIASHSAGNAVTTAHPQFFQQLIAYYPTFSLQASGPTVGLPWGERGNSEVGHLNMGAGRVVLQELARINKAIDNGSFFENPALLSVMNEVKKNNGTLHLIGLIGTGGVHAYEQHLYSLLGMAKDQGIEKIAVHAFTDGRDAPPKSAIESVKKLQSKISEIGTGFLATLVGRFYGMDRGEHWQQTQAAYDLITKGTGEKFTDAAQALLSRYDKGLTDEMIPPTAMTDPQGNPLTIINQQDGVIFFNFRNDRMIQLTKLFLKEKPTTNIATMTSYAPDFEAKIAFQPLEIKDSLGEVVSKRGWSQFHAAESEKFAHVTFFFNGHRHEPWPGEERDIVKSPGGNNNNYADVPEMSARPLTDAVIQRILERRDKLILVNYANGDMVGHTGSIPAAKQAILVLDECLAKLAKAASETGALLIITADHGNCETMVDPNTGDIATEHTSNPVPIIFYADTLKKTAKSGLTLESLAGLVPSGILPDVAPTVLYYLGVEPPMAMTGNIIRVDNSIDS